jgi:hypothetical protein
MRPVEPGQLRSDFNEYEIGKPQLVRSNSNAGPGYDGAPASPETHRKGSATL